MKKKKGIKKSSMRFIYDLIGVSFLAYSLMAIYLSINPMYFFMSVSSFCFWLCYSYWIQKKLFKVL